MTGDVAGPSVPRIDDWNRLLDGRVAVVTGGGDGIGAGITRLFATHGALVEVAEQSAATSSTSPSTTTWRDSPMRCSANTAGSTCW
jgi:3-oxoacyl-[acyl-carrier protein] reductase